MSWGYVIAGVASLAAGYMGSEAQKDAAAEQASAINNASNINQNAVNKAVLSALNTVNPQLAAFSQSMQGTIDLFSQGRINSGQLMQQGYQNASNIVSTGGQNALAALLGVPPSDVPMTTIGQNLGYTQVQPESPVAPGFDATDPNYQTGGEAITQPPSSGEMPTGITEVTPGQYLPTGDITNIPGGRQGKSPISTFDRPSGINQFNAGGLDASLPPGVTQPDGGQFPVMDASFVDGPGLINDLPQATQSQYRETGIPPGDLAQQAAEYGYFEPQYIPGNDYKLPIDDIYNYNPQSPMNPGFQPPQVTDPTVFRANFPTTSAGIQSNVIGMPTGTGAGLLGAEQAVRQGGLQGQLNLAQGAASGLSALDARYRDAAATRAAGGQFGLNQITQGINAATDATNRGIGLAQSGAAQGAAFLSPYMSAGSEALNPYMALSGARGQEAFDKALIDDPVYRYAQEEAQRGLGRSAALTGNIGSGNVMNEIQRQQQMLAQANIDRQLGRYMPIIEGGRQAAGQAGQMATQAGIAAGGMAQQGGQFEAGLRQAMANIGINTSQDLSNYARELGMTENQVLNMLGQNLANIDVSTGRQIGDYRQQAGANAANLLAQQAGLQGAFQTGLSSDLSNLDAQTLANIANTIQQGAGTQLSAGQNIANMLANTYIGQGTTQSNLAQQLGTANAMGVTNPLGNALNTWLGLYASTGGFGNQRPQNNDNQP